MAWEIEVLKTAAAAFIQYQRDEATDDSLDRLSSKLEQIVKLIQGNSKAIIDTIMRIKGDEFAGRLKGVINQFRILNDLPSNSKILFQSNCAGLYGEISQCAQNRNYLPEYLYDFLRMQIILAPIYAFANCSVRVRGHPMPEVKFIFEDAYQLCNIYLKKPVYDNNSGPFSGTWWLDPSFGFGDDHPDSPEVRFEKWIDDDLHPFTRLLVKGHWEMIGPGIPPVEWYPSVDGTPPSNSLNHSSANVEALWRRASQDPRFQVIDHSRDEMKKLLDASPRLSTTEANICSFIEANAVEGGAEHSVGPTWRKNTGNQHLLFLSSLKGNQQLDNLRAQEERLSRKFHFFGGVKYK